MKEKQILDKVEKALQSFDNDPVLEENPFLLTKILAERKTRLQNRRSGIALNFGFNKALILLILLINFITVAYYYDWSARQNLQNKLVLTIKLQLQVDQPQNIF